MQSIILGVRRLYDSLGVSIEKVADVFYKVQLSSGKFLSIYIGRKPPLGVLLMEGNQYLVPGRPCQMINTDDKYEAPCFLDVAVTIERSITEGELALLKVNDQATREHFLQEAQNEDEGTEHLLDLVSGICGLLGHRQFVLKPLIQHSFLTGDFESASAFVGPAVEILEDLQMNSNTGPNLGAILQAASGTSEELLRNAGSTFHWLLRAWRERDPIAKFMYLFIPLEAILPSNSELATDAKVELDSLEEIVQNSSVPEKLQLLQFLERTKTRFSPSLNARFEDFARTSQLVGWELDVQAFKKYNRMRNLLLHKGNRNLRSHINFDENTRTLADLVERYVSIAFFGHAHVYPSRWRPSRTEAVAGNDK